MTQRPSPATGYDNHEEELEGGKGGGGKKKKRKRSGREERTEFNIVIRSGK